MDKLIQALQIFLKYANLDFPTHCEHDVMYIMGIKPDDVSDEDKINLEKLGFYVGDSSGEEGFESYRFGSA